MSYDKYFISSSMTMTVKDDLFQTKSDDSINLSSEDKTELLANHYALDQCKVFDDIDVVTKHFYLTPNMMLEEVIRPKVDISVNETANLEFNHNSLLSFVLSDILGFKLEEIGQIFAQLNSEDKIELPKDIDKLEEYYFLTPNMVKRRINRVLEFLFEENIDISTNISKLFEIISQDTLDVNSIESFNLEAFLEKLDELIIDEDIDLEKIYYYLNPSFPAKWEYETRAVELNFDEELLVDISEFLALMLEIDDKLEINHQLFDRYDWLQPVLKFGFGWNDKTKSSNRMWNKEG